MNAIQKRSTGWVLCADILGFKNEMTGDLIEIEERVKQLESLWQSMTETLSGDGMLVSDSIFLHWSCTSNDGKEVAKQFSIARRDVRNLLDRFSACNFVLRGSMVYGDVIISSSMWAGPALFRAHALESSVIDAPIVAVPERECATLDAKCLSGVPVYDLTTKGGGLLRCRVILPNKMNDFVTQLSERYEKLVVNGNQDAARKIHNALHTIREIQGR